MTPTGRFNLSSQRRELLESLLRAEGIERAPSQTVVPREDPAAPVPLAFSQSRFWFLDRFSANSASYVVSAGLRLRGDFRPEVFTRACQEVVRRHEALRTVFHEEDGQPVQRVRDDLPPDVRTVDLRHLAGDAVAAEIERREAALVARPFDLGTGPLLRAEILDLAPDEAVVLVNLHHIVTDRWSMDILMREITSVYGALTAGRPVQLPPLTVQYADFASWQNGPQAQAAWQSDLEYWTRQLAGLPSETGLPTVLPRPKEKTYRGSSVPLELPAGLLERLRAVGREADATPFMVLTAAFQVLLARLTGNDDIVVGTPVANRTLAELEPLVGLFVNTLALRTDLSGDPTFHEALRRAATVCLEAYDHQSIPFERLVEQLQPERSLAHTPVFQVLVSYQNVPIPVWDEGAVRAQPLALEAKKAEFDLLVDMFEDDGKVWGRLEYSTDILDEAAARSLVARFERLLRAVAADPHQRIGDLPLLDDEERRPATPAAAPDRPQDEQDALLHAPFEDLARRHPDAPAVRHGGRVLTYGQTDRRANQLAHWLRRLGVQQGVLVGLCTDRSPERAIGALAVLKAGGTLLPLDPADPPQRLAQLLDDAQPPLLLTQGGARAVLPADDAEILDLDALGPALDDEPEDAPPAGTDGTHPAYLGHTAGTTGRPKGALVTHAAACHLLPALRDHFALGARDRVLHAAPFSAGTGLIEVLWPLLSGAELVLAPGTAPAAPGELAALIREADVTTVHLTPPQLQRFLDEPDAARATALRQVLSTGEPLPPALQARFHALTGAELHHLYGTRETGGPALARHCRPDDAGSPLTIGTPLAGARALVLDPARRLVPTGVTGELYLGGPALAQGYPDRPDLTAEHFTDHPFVPGERLHRTGDLARVRPDGALEIVGRTGQEATLRGFAIPVERVAAELAAHPSVREARVTVATAADGTEQVVAHVTADGARIPDPDALTAHAKERLPEYMAPSAVVVLPELPLTFDGRTDRDALPGPEPTGSGGRPGFTEPRDDLERAIAVTWQKLLGAARVGAHDNFFDLGGHSLLLTKLASQLSSAHGLHVPLRMLFDNPTVAQMAAWIGARQAEGTPKATAIPVTGRDGGVPLSFAQEELYVHQPVPAEDPFHNVLTAVTLTGPLDEAALRHTLDSVVRRHEALRTRVVVRDGTPVQLVEADGTWPLAVVDLSAHEPAARRAELRRLVATEERRAFRLAEETLVRGTLVRLAEDEHVLVQVMHHLVTDNWSYGILFHEMRELYRARVHGTEARLPRFEVEFADVAAWQQQQLADGELDPHLDHWRDRLAGLPPTLRFTAPAHQEVPPATGSTAGFVLDARSATAVADLGRREGATSFMVLLAAFGVLLSAYSGSDDIPVDFPVAGRERPETENLIGYFVNHLVVRSDLTGDPTFRDLVGQVRERTLSAYAHQSAPLWALDGAVPEGHDPSGISFNLLNATVPAVELEGLTTTPLDLGIGDDYVFSEVVINVTPDAVDLALIMREEESGALRGMWLYDLEAVDARAVAAMTRQWPRLVEAVTAGPDRPVRELRQLLLAPLRPGNDAPTTTERG
ncbi:putative non-ribosomal peptide synthetase [Streptomyces sp. NBRC 110611]|uniref:non-ribosomal peptide synthetase n=1 Tax=Streptomyces sp. NBRC 110611 TaxID=1621259 RepID=UPI0008343B55|nr:non-ribosomal peptide synthetase [Streptomyces sp. NBRC 110611]GAU68942.1 putative non-ribosomal peptide synthetase [Streptomyces sp. NBRC 110611]